MSNLVTTEAVQQLVATLSEKDIAPTRLTQAFHQSSQMKKFVEKLYDLGRERTLKYLQEYGERFGSGSLRAHVGDYKLEAVTTGTGYDDKKVEALLRTKGYDPSVGMDATITYKTNPEKLARALSDNELSACKKEQAYRVNAPKLVNEENND